VEVALLQIHIINSVVSFSYYTSSYYTCTYILPIEEVSIGCLAMMYSIYSNGVYIRP
jgi:hypothetical protein